jgi:hypothetical protein
MRCIGLSFQKGRIRLTVLDLLKGEVKYHESRAITVDPDLPIPDLMDRYATQIRTLIGEFAPQIVAVRQVWNSKNVDAAMCQVAPPAIAAYVCHERGIPFTTYTPQALRQPKPFGLDRGVNPLEAVNDNFGEHPPYWDDMQKSSLLVAWRALLEHK